MREFIDFDPYQALRDLQNTTVQINLDLQQITRAIQDQQQIIDILVQVQTRLNQRQDILSQVIGLVEKT